MKPTIKTVLSALVISTLMTGCGSNSSSVADTNNAMNNNNGMQSGTNARFVPMTMNNQTVMRDTKTNLEWVERVPKAVIP